MNKAIKKIGASKYQLDVLQKLFFKANVNPLTEDPFIQLKKIDWSTVKADLTLAENLHILVEKYPNYNWSLYPNINEILADDLGIFEVEIKPLVQTVKGKEYIHGKILVTLPKHLIGSKARIVIVQPVTGYIQSWTKRMKDLQTLFSEENKQCKIEDFFV